METYDEMRAQRDDALAELEEALARIAELEDDIRELNGLRWASGLRQEEVIRLLIAARM